MFEPIKIDRKLPPHELNARRDRKRIFRPIPDAAHVAKPKPKPNLDPDHDHDHDPAVCETC